MHDSYRKKLLLVLPSNEASERGTTGFLTAFGITDL